MLFGAALPLVAQHASPVDTVTLLAELITVEDGLPQGMVQCMLQDRSGYLWFGTRGGLARSDGYGFTTYQHQENDSTSISSNIIRVMLEDHAGYLWLGMESGEVDRYDPRTERFQHIVRDPGTPAGQWPEIRSVGVDGQHNIWVYSHHAGLRVIRGDQPSGPPRAEDPRTVFSGVHWPEHVTGADVDTSGMLWCISADSVMTFDATTKGSTMRTLEGSAWPHKALPDSAALKSGVARMQSLRDGANAAGVRTMQDHLWVAQEPNSYRIRHSDGRIERIRFTEIHGKRINPELVVICWMQDRAGNIWAGTNGYGVLKVTRTRQRFRHLPDVNSIYRCSATGALALNQTHDEHWTDASGHITHGVLFKSLDRMQLLMTPGVWTMDAQGRGWLSAAPDWKQKPRLCLIDRSGTVTFPDIIPAGLYSRSVFPGLGDQAWILAANDSHFLAELLLVDTRAERLLGRFPFPSKERIWSEITSLVVADDRTVWLVCSDGLYQLDTITSVWKILRHHHGDPSSLPSDRLLSMCFDPEDPVNVIWVGTAGSGLVKYDRRSGVVERYTTKEGLPNNVVYGIMPDERRNLWFSTDVGLCRLDPRSKGLQRYTFEDGLLSNEFNARAAGATADGRMFFGGPMGTTWFRPAEFYSRTAPAATVLTGLRLTNSDVAVGSFALPGADGSLLPEAIAFASTISVPYRERMITFTFACMDHTAPQRNTFRYKLQEFNTDWIEAGATHEATFTNLDPGRYTFLVQGRTSEGVWDMQGAHITLVIIPPWWSTWWFRIIAALVLAGALYAFYHYRLMQAMKVVRVRENIARDLHDEIGSTLSSVQLYSAVAQRKSRDRSPETTELLGQITEGTTSALEAMNDIVWAVNAENDNMAQVVQRMNSYAMRNTDAMDCELGFQVQQGIATQHLGMTQRKNLYLIFKEAVNNAVKYADPHTLTIHLEAAGAGFLLRVMDDGKGFDPDAVAEENAMGGNGLDNMRRRAAEMDGILVIRSAPGSGTTVELRFNATSGKSRVPLMNSGGDVR
ncbi:MAG: hypothetical protein JNM62_11810 [Flavobacteriales bacterium]|nr:hypothetical protein [Flavobacteriales bacterium]